jgi:hypothetical protein
MTSTRVVLTVSSLVTIAVAAACSSSSSDLTLGDDTPLGDAGSGTDSTVAANDSGTPVDSGAPIDAGPDARPEPSCAGIAYCENFETYDDAGALKNNDMLGPWKVAIGVPADAGSPEPMGVDTINPYGGFKSLHIQVPNKANSSTHLLEQTNTGATGLVGNDLWGRAMVYFKGSKPNGHTWVFQGIGASTESGDLNMSLNLADQGTNYFLNYHGTFMDAGAETSQSGGTPAQDKWVCLQWEYNASGGTPVDQAKVWADGALIIDSKAAPVQAWQLADPFTQMQLGWVHYPQTTEAIDLYIDDFALNNTMIPCP